MANEKKGPPPAAMDKGTVKKLLDRLETDDDFRQLFQKDTNAALADIGCQTSGGCLQFAAGATLASAKQIKQARGALERALSVPFTHDCPAGLTD